MLLPALYFWLHGLYTVLQMTCQDASTDLHHTSDRILGLHHFRSILQMCSRLFATQKSWDVLYSGSPRMHRALGKHRRWEDQLKPQELPQVHLCPRNKTTLSGVCGTGIGLKENTWRFQLNEWNNPQHITLWLSEVKNSLNLCFTSLQSSQPGD